MLDVIKSPVVVLVGRPNVGKSTLFNRFTRTQNALVADFPGLTRDRQYGDAIFEDKSFIVVDTGGVGVEDQAIDDLMSKQSQVALDEADFVLFLVDGRAGRTGIDEKIAQSLRKCSKPVILLINKIDGTNQDLAVTEFHDFGIKDIFCVSASHGRGIHQLLSYLTASFPTQPEEIPTDDNIIRITFVGRPNVGKSTLINRILGEERVVVYDMPGTTRDSISVPFTRESQEYCLIDTAGIRRRARVSHKIEKFSIIKTLQSIKETHVCLLLVDAQEGLTEQDLHLLGYIIEAGKALVVVINKWDGLDIEHKENVKTQIERRLHFVSYAKIRYISALHGSNVGTLWDDIHQAYKSAYQKLSTPNLTRLLESFTTSHPPPLVANRRIKLRYAHTGGHNPPIIVVHGNQVNALPDSYKRYLMNSYIEALHLVGTPLKIEFKSGENPYKDKKNTLTPRQVHKKKRLMKYHKKKR